MRLHGFDQNIRKVYELKNDTEEDEISFSVVNFIVDLDGNESFYRIQNIRRLSKRRQLLLAIPAN